jgi:hypothetical protein
MRPSVSVPGFEANLILTIQIIFSIFKTITMLEKNGRATPEQIAKWKQEFGKVFYYEVDDKICYLRPVDRTTYSLALSKVSTSPAKFNEIVMEKIWLGGDEEIRKNDQYYFGLIDYVEELMNKKKGSLGEC